MRLDSLMQWFAQRSWPVAVVLMLVENLALFAVVVATGRFAVKHWAHRRVAPKVLAIRRGERLLGFGAVAMNTAITVTGWWMWRHDWIRISGRVGLGAFVEAIWFCALIDLFMYPGTEPPTTVWSTPTSIDSTIDSSNPRRARFSHYTPLRFSALAEHG